MKKNVIFTMNESLGTQCPSLDVRRGEGGTDPLNLDTIFNIYFHDLLYLHHEKILKIIPYIFGKFSEKILVLAPQAKILKNIPIFF